MSESIGLVFLLKEKSRLEERLKERRKALTMAEEWSINRKKDVAETLLELELLEKDIETVKLFQVREGKK